MRFLFGGSGPLRLAGGTIMVIEIMRALRSRGHDAVALAEAPPEPWWPSELPLIVGTFESVGPLDRFDGIVTGPYGVGPALDAGGRVVVHLVAGFEPHLWPLMRERFAEIYRLPTLKAVIAPHLQRTLRDELGVDSVVIGSPIDLSRFVPDPEPRAEEGPPRVLTVGPEPDAPYAPLPFKGIANVLEIVRRTRAEGEELRLVRMTPIEDSLCASDQIDELHVGVDPREAPSVYRSCDVYLGASTPAEGLGMPPIEAACSGIPSVIPEIPSFLETPGLERCSLFYPAGDLDAAGAVLRRLLDDRELRGRLGAQGPHSGLQEHFDPGRVAERLAEAIAARRR